MEMMINAEDNNCLFGTAELSDATKHSRREEATESEDRVSIPSQ